MDMDEPRSSPRRIKQEKGQRRTSAGDSRRRITKFDGKFHDYAALKASTNVVIPEVKKVLLKRKKSERVLHRTNIIYPSEMARADWCPRATYYRMSGLPEPSSTTSFTLDNVFAEGNAIHHKWQSWLAETGLLWGDWRCSRCSEIVRNSLKPEGTAFGSCVGVDWIVFPNDTFTGYKKPSGQVPFYGKAENQFPHDWRYKEVTLSSKTHKISGHADGALIKHNCLIEIKSLGIGTLRFEAPALLEQNTYEVSGKKIIDIDGLWKNFHRPLFSHIKQGNIYLWMAQQMNLPFDSIVFLYEFKANQQVKEFQVKMSQDILAPLLTMAESIEYALGKGVPPACPFGGCGQCRAYEEVKVDK